MLTGKTLPMIILFNASSVADSLSELIFPTGLFDFIQNYQDEADSFVLILVLNHRHAIDVHSKIRRVPWKSLFLSLDIKRVI